VAEAAANRREILDMRRLKVALVAFGLAMGGTVVGTMHVKAASPCTSPINLGLVAVGVQTGTFGPGTASVCVVTPRGEDDITVGADPVGIPIGQSVAVTDPNPTVGTIFIGYHTTPSVGPPTVIPIEVCTPTNVTCQTITVTINPFNPLGRIVCIAIDTAPPGLCVV
jgi:hypothetical protein